MLTQRLQDDLDHQDIERAEVAEDMVWYRLHPPGRCHRPIALLCWNDELDGFSEVSLIDDGYHYHVDEYREMIDRLRPVVSGAMELVRQLDGNGRCLRGDLAMAGALPERVDDDAQSLRRHRFGRPPVTTPVPRAAYVRTKHGLVTPEYHALLLELQRLHHENGWPLPFEL